MRLGFAIVQLRQRKPRLVRGRSFLTTLASTIAATGRLAPAGRVLSAAHGLPGRRESARGGCGDSLPRTRS